MNRSERWLACWPPVRPEPSYDATAHRRRCPRRSRGVRGGVHRPDVLQRLRARSCSTPAGCSATSSASSGCRSPRPRRWGRSATGSAPAMRRFARDQQVPWVDFAKGQRKDDVMHEHLARFDRRGGGAVHRAGAGEDQPVPHREAPQRRRRRPTRGSCAPPGWSTTSTSTPSTPTSGRSSSSSAPTSRTTPSCASTATSGPSGRPPRPGSGSPRWTTGSPPAPTRPRCRRSATGSARTRSTRCCASGWPILPHPFTAADRAAGYRYDISICRPSSP